jgi:hypothetical protein
MSTEKSQIDDDFDDIDDELGESYEEFELQSGSGNTGNWRRVELLLEQKRLDKELSGFDDYLLD